MVIVTVARVSRWRNV